MGSLSRARVRAELPPGFSLFTFHFSLFASLLFLTSAASADWRDHADLPEWARRGALQWGHGANVNGRIKWVPIGFGVDAPNAQLILDCGRNLQQTIAYLHPVAERIARAGGLHRQPYICSQTVWWRSEYPKYPGLDGGVRLGLDGKPIIIYDNPQRHCGCYNNPRWFEQMKIRVRETLQGPGGKVDSLFFDNPLPYDCYCSFCRDKFRQFTGEKLGVAMDLTAREQPNYTFAKAFFQAESTREFFEKVKAFLRTLDPAVTISPNWGAGSAVSNYLNAHRATDMVFCENGFTLPPDQSTVVEYKLGLASSHGLAVGQLLGLSEMLRRERALALDKSNEMGILESFVYPEEHALSFAEALSCDGTYIQSFALREQKITVSEAPYQVQNRRMLERYARFEKAHRDLYAGAQPGGSVAVLYSLWSQMAAGGYSAREFRAACEALGRAGIPYEVVVEEDLVPARLAAYQALILPQARSFSREDADAVLAFARAGGAVVALGTPAVCDRHGRAYAADALPELAKVPAGAPQAAGKGHVWRIAEDLGEMPPVRLAAALERLAGPPAVQVKTASARLFANVLRAADGQRRSVHLVNSDFTFEPRASTDVRDDRGTAGARTFLATTTARIRKTLLVPDPAALKKPVVRFFANACWGATDAFSVLITLNGQEIANYKGNALKEPQWFEVPVPDGLLHKKNEIVFRATGKPNGHPDWFALKIDTSAATRRSSWSDDEGKTWTEKDISLDAGTQTGELLVRFGEPTDPNAVAKPEDFMGRLKVRPARDVDVLVKTAGPAPPARLLSPDVPEQLVKPTVAGGVATYRVPAVSIYSVLVLP